MGQGSLPQDDSAIPESAAMNPLGSAIPATVDVDFPNITRAIYIGGGGDLVVIMGDDQQTVTFSGTQGGSMLPIRARQITSASTATGIVGLW